MRLGAAQVVEPAEGDALHLLALVRHDAAVVAELLLGKPGHIAGVGRSHRCCGRCRQRPAGQPRRAHFDPAEPEFALPYDCTSLFRLFRGTRAGEGFTPLLGGIRRNLSAGPPASEGVEVAVMEAILVGLLVLVSGGGSPRAVGLVGPPARAGRRRRGGGPRSGAAAARRRRVRHGGRDRAHAVGAGSRGPRRAGRIWLDGGALVGRGGPAGAGGL